MTDIDSTIGAVERDTGIPKDTLRIWERRYGFPVPSRNAQGERSYPATQVTTLRLLKRVVDSGHRPGKVVGLSDRSLRELVSTTGEVRVVLDGELDAAFDALQRQDTAALYARLQGLMMRYGLERFVVSQLAPLVRAVGQAWADGVIAIHQEHLFSDQVERLLAMAIGQALPRAGSRPILLATLPGETHRLGLRMVEAILAARGVHSVSVGADLPVSEIVDASRVHQAATVALSVSASQSGPATARSLDELRAALPDDTGLWIGGLGAGLSHPVVECGFPTGRGLLTFICFAG